MPRPFKCRAINWKPVSYYFKPQGITLSSLDVVELFEDEFEALRLKEYEKKDQNESAELMHISQPTFYRIYSSAKEKMIKALVEGKAIKIRGENMPNRDKTGPEGKGPTGMRRGPCGQGKNPKNDLPIDENQETMKTQNFGRGQGLRNGQGRGQGLRNGRGLGRRNQ